MAALYPERAFLLGFGRAVGLCQRSRSPERVFGHDAKCADHTTGFERMRHHSVTASLAVVINLLILKDLTLVSRAGLEYVDAVENRQLIDSTIRGMFMICPTGGFSGTKRGTDT